MRLYLHIGSHKTGTTAIQHFAAQNRDHLAKQGLLYPPVGPKGAPARRNHMLVFGGWFGLAGANDLTSEDISAFFARTRAQALKRKSDVLLSGENIFRLTAEQRDELYARLRQTFPDFDIVVVAALRRQDNFADSLFRNVVRGQIEPTRVPPTWPEFLRSRADLFDYWSIVSQAWEGLGSRPILIPYGGTARREIVPTFFSPLGVDVAGARPLTERVNLSFDYLDCCVKWMLHDLRVNEQTFRRYDEFAGSNPSRTPYSFFSPTGRRELLDRYADGNTALCVEYPELADVLGNHVIPDFAATPTESTAREVERRFFDFHSFLRSRGSG